MKSSEVTELAESPQEFHWWYQGRIVGMGWLFGGLFFTFLPLTLFLSIKLSPVVTFALCGLGLCLLFMSFALLRGYENATYRLFSERIERRNTFGRQTEGIAFADVTRIVLYKSTVGFRNDRAASYVGEDTLSICYSTPGFEEVLTRGLSLCDLATLSCEPLFVDEIKPELLDIVAGPREYSSENGAVSILENWLISTVPAMTGKWDLMALNAMVTVSSSRYRSRADLCFIRFPDATICFGERSLGGRILPFVRSVLAYRSVATRIIDTSGDLIRLSQRTRSMPK